tara:strand:+ start:38 stop:418 length:381 start_codon:yes stop_codon:yes gene_type:complete
MPKKLPKSHTRKSLGLDTSHPKVKKKTPQQIFLNNIVTELHKLEGDPSHGRSYGYAELFEFGIQNNYHKEKFNSTLFDKLYSGYILHKMEEAEKGMNKKKHKNNKQSKKKHSKKKKPRKKKYSKRR